ncbi:MAG: hypothetical protein ACK5I7_00370 [Anaerotignum sp.]
MRGKWGKAWIGLICVSCVLVFSGCDKSSEDISENGTVIEEDATTSATKTGE